MTQARSELRLTLADYAQQGREVERDRQAHSRPPRLDSVVLVRSDDYLMVRVPREGVWPIGLLLLTGIVALVLWSVEIVASVRGWWSMRRRRNANEAGLA